ncbi:MAG TPA: NUDIX hydrolase, partial [Trebonia sp.]|nr:NUDIX hydrolase [Trebonia sp.]
MVRDVIEGRKEPVTPRDAATVMLLRPAVLARGDDPPEPPAAAAAAAGERAETSRGFEVYMLRRKPTMAFAPGAYVFPGGSVDQRDADEEVAWAGPDVGTWARQL